MRISDWSSDVCSSDLPAALDARLVRRRHCRLYGVAETQLRARRPRHGSLGSVLVLPAPTEEAGRHVHPFERIVDAIEMRHTKIAREGKELITEESAYRETHAVHSGGHSRDAAARPGQGRPARQ